MLRKSFLVLMCLMVFTFSISTSIKRAEATGVETVAAGVATVAGTAAGPYIVAGLLVAAGAAVVVGANDPEIRAKAIDIYNRTSSGFKKTLSDSIAAGNTTITWTQSMTDEIKTAAISAGATASINTLLKMYETKAYNVSTSGNLKMSYFGERYHLDAVDSAKYTFLDTIGGYSLYSNYFFTVKYTDARGWVDTNFLSGSAQMTAANTFNSNKTVANLEAVVKAAGFSTYQVLKTSLAAPKTTLDTNLDTALGSIKEVDIPLDNWLAGATTSTGEAISVNPTTGAITYPNGTTYTGEVKLPWTVPAGSTGTFPNTTVSNPSVPVSDVFPTNPDVPTTDGTIAGLLSGLWDWLKGILQSILDAILALVGLIADIFIPRDAYFEDIFKDIKAKFDLKLPLISSLATFFGGVKDSVFSSSKPKFEITLPAKWGGGTYSIIDFKYFDDYRVWIINFVRFSAWYVFLRRLYNRIPKIVY